MFCLSMQIGHVYQVNLYNLTCLKFVKAGEDHHTLPLHLKLKHEMELVVKGLCNVVVSTKQNGF